jgi:geranylgeranylglycerol-phosphate geranylgeranyltransferase
MIGFAVIVGEFVSKPPQVPFDQSVLGFLTGFFLCSYSMAANDIYDVEVDRVNQPARPIPSGRMSVRTANRLSILSLLAGMACSVLSLSPIAVTIAAGYAFLAWLYSYRAKKEGLSGNLIVASSLAIPFVYGGVVSKGSVFISLLLSMALTAFFAGAGREVVKTMADVEGDEKRGVNSLARRKGMRAAAMVGGACFLLAVFTSWVPLVYGLANRFYTLGVVIPDAIFVYLAVSIAKNRSAPNAHRVKTIALFGMLVGLVVFIGGGL